MKTTQKFIIDAKHIHGNKYDYSKVNYVNSVTKVCIICPEHGEFWQTPHSHLNGRNCPLCGKRKKNYKKTKEYFIIQAQKKHKNKFDYSKVNYIDNKTKVCIICPEHGEFWQTPHSHLNTKYPCKQCMSFEKKKKVKYTTDEFIQLAKKIHGNKFDYSKVNYIDNKTKVCIICPEHGEFWQIPTSHLMGRGCNKCSKSVFDTKSFIKKAITVHENKYDYSKVEYKNSYTKVCIICPEHGEFWQTPGNHLSGKGCFLCKKEERDKKQFLTTKEFVSKSQKIHGDKYNYSKVNYINSNTKVCIICPKHGEFWQTPNKHLTGENCPLCNVSKLEEQVMIYLDKINVSYIKEFSPYWANKKRYDFCIKDKKIIIECQGEQHYYPINFGGQTEETIKDIFLATQKNDKFKKKIAEEHGYKLVYYTKKELKKNNEITNLEDLKKIIYE